MVNFAIFERFSGADTRLFVAEYLVSAPEYLVSGINNLVFVPEYLVSGVNNLVSGVNNLVSAPEYLASGVKNLVSDVNNLVCEEENHGFVSNNLQFQWNYFDNLVIRLQSGSCPACHGISKRPSINI